MDHSTFKAWLDRYVDAWRLGDPIAIGDLFSEDVRYAFGPFDEAVVGRRAVTAAWLADQDQPGTWEADYEVLAIDGDAHVAHGRTRYLTDDLSRSIASSPTSSSAGSTTRAVAASSPSTTCAAGLRQFRTDGRAAGPGHALQPCASRSRTPE